jgi:hypothetical protein
MARSPSRKRAGPKRTVSAPKVLKSSGSHRGSRERFVVCLSNEGCGTSLQVRKIYTSLVDPEAEMLGMLRVIDESGEDYLYPQLHFGPIDLPRTTAKALAKPATHRARRRRHV